jgi:NADPH2:quinone reductase
MPMPQEIRAVVVDPAAPERLAVRPVELRDPDRDEVRVRVSAISLNRGETRRAVQQAEPGWRPGWDFAGVVESAAADGSGPAPGTRVVGLLPSGAWAERVNCRTHAVAVLPEGVSDAAAATLPVAGLTALHALRQGGLLLGRKVLIDGASGGVGHLACQLAAAAGAEVWGQVRREETRAAVAAWCGGRVVLGRDLAAAKPFGPFWLIVDSLGGGALGAALGMLQAGGTCVTLGVSEGTETRFASRDFFATGGTRLYGLTLFHELMSVERAGLGLALLAGLIAAGTLRPQIALEAPWSEIGTIARRLIDREFAGKAVLHVG